MTYKKLKQAIKDIGKDELRELIDEYGADVVEGFMDEGYSLEDFREAYQGKYESDVEFVQDLLESCGDIPKDLPSYIVTDWEATAETIMYDFFKIGDHYFRNL